MIGMVAPLSRALLEQGALSPEVGEVRGWRVPGVLSWERGEGSGPQGP